ncbi:phage tail protein [Actinoplanes couchii]|nr:phage tail protein [Actinoplanes couchii]
MSTTSPSMVPIGTIATFAGGLDTGWLKQQGWLYCDGSEVIKSDYADLFFAIGGNYGSTRTTFFLPDLRARFERGVDAQAKRDPYVGDRQAANSGGLTSDNPGSVEGCYTARPGNAFTTASGGAHSHGVPHMPTENSAGAIAGSHYGIWNDNTSQTDAAGDHSHTIVTGGDMETRPINKYVYHVIKFQG